MTKELTEHEKLKWICDEIGYEFDRSIFWWNENENLIFQQVSIDVREIIFTQEFMDKLTTYINDYEKIGIMKHDLIRSLDEPVNYLFNLIKN